MVISKPHFPQLVTALLWACYARKGRLKIYRQTPNTSRAVGFFTRVIQ